MADAPACIGIILDGNRRWASAHGLPKLEGHRTGLLTTLKEVIEAVKEKGIPHLAVYLFSTENWNREETEVTYLMDLFREQWKSQLSDLGGKGVRVRFVGQRERFSPDLQQVMTDMEKETAHNTTMTLWACMSYGGRAEIAAAASAAAKAGEEVTEASIEKHLWTADMPEPDIIIRTSGEHRLSGFLTWKATYSELFFVDVMWPDFGKEQLAAVLAEFAQRERRIGR